MKQKRAVRAVASETVRHGMFPGKLAVNLCEETPRETLARLGEIERVLGLHKSDKLE